MLSTKVAILLFTLFLVIVSVDAGAQVNVTVNSKVCSDCWVASRNNLTSCQSISANELSNFAQVTDTSLAQNSKQFPGVISCICEIATKTDSMLAGCAGCIGDVAAGLKNEAQIVASKICNNTSVGKPGSGDGNGSGSDGGDSSVNTNSQPDGNTTVASYSNAANFVAPVASSGSLFSLALFVVAASVLTL